MDVWQQLNVAALPSPCFVVDEVALKRNLAVLDQVQRRSGAKILLALKGFAMFSLFPIIRPLLRGACASGPHEARLAREEFGGEVHTFAPAYGEADFDEVLALSDVIIFNSFDQWRRFRGRLGAAPRPLSCGIRINPECSLVEVDLYNPCAPFSRLGVTRANFQPDQMDGIDGLHFHCLCEQNVDALEAALAAVEEKFGAFIPRLRWMNFGGGHHITRADYQVDRLVELIVDFRHRHANLEAIYLEPGEAVALNTGVLVATVLDIVDNGMPIAILDVSAETHMPDVLAMPYRPEILGGGHPGRHPHTYRLGGPTCLAGDIVGDYSFPAPLAPGDRLLFLDMAHYSMVKTTTFNGMRLPSIAIWNSNSGTFRLVRQFGYQDYRNRLS